MVRLNSKGFVSNFFVCQNIISTILISSLFASLMWLVTDIAFIKSFILSFCIFGSFYHTIEYLRFPFMYKRYVINEEGIKCGRNFVRYDSIEKISISRGFLYTDRVKSAIYDLWGNFDHFRTQVEDVICINCDFAGFERKKIKDCIHVPMTRRNNALLRKYCKQYNYVFDEWHKEILKEDKFKFKFAKYPVMIGFCNLIIIILVFILLAANGLIPAYKLFLVLPIIVVTILFLGFDDYISALVRYKINAKL